MHRRAFLAGTAATALARPAFGQAARTLRFVPQANLTSLDPVWTTATVTNNHAYYVFDTLYGADMDLVARPQMASGHTVSADNLVWTIRLRDGLLFHDGTKVRAADCIASLKRWCRRDSYGQLLGKAVAEWNAPDDSTIELRLARPFPALPDALAKVDGPAVIMPERLAVTDAMAQVTEMVGSGPYRFVAGEYVPGNRVVYEKFAGYVPRAEPPSRNAGGKIGHYDRVEWHVIPDPATAAAALMAGEVDWWERPLADLQPMLATNARIKREVTDPTGRLSIMRLNHLHPPFNNPKVRAAVRMAVVQEDYMTAAQGDDRTAWQVCRSLWPKGTPYYAGEEEALMPQDIKAAGAALKASGYGGETVVIINPTDFPDIGPLGQVTADTLRRIGMKVDLLEADWGTVIQRRSSREPAERGGWSIFHTSGSAVGWANPAVSVLVRGQGAAGWFGWWSNAKAEALAEAWLEGATPAAQRDAAVALGRLALEDGATIPLGQFTIKTAYRTTLAGMLPGSAPYPWGVKPA
jgi:peptide/nickel transport system substrate-binding protein